MIVLMAIWGTFAFNFFIMLIYLKYLPGSIYANALATCSAEMLGRLAASYILIKIGVKHLNSLSLTFAICGALSIIFFPESSFMFVLVLLTRFGVCMSTLGAYSGVILLIPTQLVSTAMGVCNITARLLTIAAPLFAQME
jgi:hypothetical protein